MKYSWLQGYLKLKMEVLEESSLLAYCIQDIPAKQNRWSDGQPNKIDEVMESLGS